MNKSAFRALEAGADLTIVRDTSILQAAQFALVAGNPEKLAELCQELVRRANDRVKSGPVVRLTTRLGSKDARGITVWRKVLVVGCEGGSFTLREAERDGERGFALVTNDCTGYWLDEEDAEPRAVQRPPFFANFHEAVGALPASWPKFHPVFVDPDFWPDLQKELVSRKFDYRNWQQALGNPFI